MELSNGLSLCAQRVLGAITQALQLSDAVIDNVAETIAITANRPTTLEWLLSSTASFADIAEAQAAVAGADASGSVALTDGGGPYALDFGAASGSLYFTYWAEGVGPITAPITVTAPSSSIVDHDYQTDVTGNAIYIPYGGLTLSSQPSKVFTFPTLGAQTGAQMSTGGSSFARSVVYIPYTVGQNYTLEFAATFHKKSSTGANFGMDLQAVTAPDVSGDAGAQLIADYRPYGTTTGWSEQVAADEITSFTGPAGGTHLRLRARYSNWLGTAAEFYMYKFKLDAV